MSGCLRKIMGERNTVVLDIDRLVEVAGRPAKVSGGLFYLLSAFIGAYNRRTDAHARGLNAIALALSTPQDNSTQVQAAIDKMTAELNAGTAMVQDAINQQQKGE